jgi:hypothetical protein
LFKLKIFILHGAVINDLQRPHLGIYSTCFNFSSKTD